MSLENIYYIGQTVAVLAIIASLIFVGLQLRQNTLAQNLAAQQAFNSMKFQHMSLLIADADVATLHRKGLKDFSSLDEIERWRFGALMQQVTDMAFSVYRFSNAYEYNIEGIIMVTMKQPGAIEWWRKGRLIYPKHFSEEVDKWIAE